MVAFARKEISEKLRREKAIRILIVKHTYTDHDYHCFLHLLNLTIRTRIQLSTIWALVVILWIGTRATTRLDNHPVVRLPSSFLHWTSFDKYCSRYFRDALAVAIWLLSVGGPAYGLPRNSPVGRSISVPVALKGKSFLVLPSHAEPSCFAAPWCLNSTISKVFSI